MAKKKLSLREIMEEEKRLKAEKERLITETYITIGKKYHQLVQLDNADVMIDELADVLDKKIANKKNEIKNLKQKQSHQSEF